MILKGILLVKQWSIFGFESIRGFVIFCVLLSGPPPASGQFATVSPEGELQLLWKNLAEKQGKAVEQWGHGGNFKNFLKYPFILPNISIVPQVRNRE